MLSNRLLEVAKFIENGSVVADIGCDHALLSIFLVEKGIAKQVIASDLNQGPLNNAKKNIALKNLNNLIETRLGSGLKTINSGEVDTCVISGMGGTLITKILDESYSVFQTIDNVITQANNSNFQLRKYMVAAGYKISNESFVEENDIIYNIIHFIKGESNYSEIELKYGPLNIKVNSDLFQKHLLQLLESKEKILKQIPTSNKEKRSEFESEINEIKTLQK